jgi:hypothetical protein
MQIQRIVITIPIAETHAMEYMDACVFKCKFLTHFFAVEKGTPIAFRKV